MVESTFRELMHRVRLGESEAASEIVRLYQNEIRRSIRIRLTDSRLQRTLDSMDICQSVLANFFVRAAAGQFDLDNPQQLLGLLLRMAHNKLIDKARMEQVRGAAQHEPTDPQPILAGIADSAASPSEQAANRELLAAAHRLLTPDERRLVEQRAKGLTWHDIATSLGRSPDAVRKQFERSLDRVVEQLGLASRPPD